MPVKAGGDAIEIETGLAHAANLILFYARYPRLIPPTSWHFPKPTTNIFATRTPYSTRALPLTCPLSLRRSGFSTFIAPRPASTRAIARAGARASARPCVLL